MSRPQIVGTHLSAQLDKWPDRGAPFVRKREQCTKTQFKSSKGDVDLYPVEVSVSYPDVYGSKLPKHASAAI
jgi:hypothetical protein